MNHQETAVFIARTLNAIRRETVIGPEYERMQVRRAHLAQAALMLVQQIEAEQSGYAGDAYIGTARCIAANVARELDIRFWTREYESAVYRCDQQAIAEAAAQLEIVNHTPANARLVAQS